MYASPIYQAIANSHRDVSTHLMEKTDRAVLELTDRYGRQPLHYAAGLAEEDENAMYDWLLEFGAEESKKDDVRIKLLEEVLSYLTQYLGFSSEIRPSST